MRAISIFILISIISIANLNAQVLEKDVVPKEYSRTGVQIYFIQQV